MPGDSFVWGHKAACPWWCGCDFLSAQRGVPAPDFAGPLSLSVAGDCSGSSSKLDSTAYPLFVLCYPQVCARHLTVCQRLQRVALSGCS